MIDLQAVAGAEALPADEEGQTAAQALAAAAPAASGPAEGPSGAAGGGRTPAEVLEEARARLRNLREHDFVEVAIPHAHLAVTYGIVDHQVRWQVELRSAMSGGPSCDAYVDFLLKAVREVKLVMPDGERVAFPGVAQPPRFDIALAMQLEMPETEGAQVLRALFGNRETAIIDHGDRVAREMDNLEKAATEEAAKG